ncbi:MAG: phosphatidate cytidylyltransferase, partial [Acidimicrobiales bacterium]
TRARTDEGAAPAASAAGRNLPMAILVGGGFAIVALFLFLFGGNLGPWLLATVVVMACAYELFGVFQRAGLRPATLLGLTSCFALMWGAYARGGPAVTLVLFLAFVGSMLWYLAKVINARPLLGVATTMLGIVWVGVLGSFAALMLVGGPSGRMLLLGAILCAVASDIGGLAAGTLFGRSPIAPDISPNKTVEGTLGGLALCMLVGIVVGLTSGVWDKSLANGLLLGLVVGVVAPIGDLSQSLIKRDLGVKDMGNALPGHGGFLDRFDSLLFALPAVYFLALSIL